MFRVRGQFGFTLIEIMVVLTVVLILAGALLGVGKYITVRAQIQLCESQLAVICTALGQYYDDHEAFPFEADLTYVQADMEADLNGTVSSGLFTGLPAGPSSAALYYFLDHSVNSRKINAALSGDLLTNKGSSGADLKITVSGEDKDLVRFIDPWGMSVRYEYASGAAFPKLTSAGPDRLFGTSDDIKSP